MKKSIKKDHNFFLNAIKLLLLVIIFFESNKVWPNDSDSSPNATETAQDALTKSQEVRREIAQKEGRSLATISKDQEKWDKEFERLEEDRSDKDWFSEVDKVIEN